MDLMYAADSGNTENVRQIYQAMLLLRLEGSMEGYDLPEEVVAAAEKVRGGCGWRAKFD